MLRNCEKATKFEKVPTCFDVYSVVKTSGVFFQIFVAFSENLNINRETWPMLATSQYTTLMLF